MRSCLIALRAAGAATVLVLAPATAAHAQDSVEVTLAPATVVPGGEVAISVSGCQGTTATVTSQAFAADVELSSRTGSQFSGQTTVKAGVSLAAYEVSVVCDGHRHPAKGQIKVVQQPTDHQTPVAPVRAGGGGAAHLAVATTDRVEGTGPGTPHAVIGLVLAGVAAIAVAFRSSRRRRTESD